MQEPTWLQIALAAWILPVCLYRGHVRWSRGAADLRTGSFVIGILLLPGIALATYLAQRLHDTSFGPVSPWREGFGLVFFVQGAPFGAAAACLAGLLAGQCVRWWQDWVRGRPLGAGYPVPGPDGTFGLDTDLLKYPPGAGAPFIAQTGAALDASVSRRSRATLSQPQRLPVPVVLAAALAVLALPIVVILATTPRANQSPIGQVGLGPFPSSRADLAVKEASIAATGPFAAVDIRPWANQNLADDMLGNPGNHLRGLPVGKLKTPSSEFDVSGSIVHLRGANAPALPSEVVGIPVDSKVRRLHVLHGVNYGGGSQAASLYGKEVARYVVHYADGTSAAVAAHYGEDVCDWWAWADAPVPFGKATAIVAWTGKNPAAAKSGVGVRLFRSVWRNPRPEDRVATVDFLSAGTICDPFLVAMTVEK